MNHDSQGTQNEQGAVNYNAQPNNGQGTMNYAAQTFVPNYG